MADNVAINQGVGTTIATDERNAFHEQLVVAGKHIRRFQLTPTISNGVAYATGDVLGTLQEITNAARFTNGSGLLRSITVLDKTQAQRSALDILFFDRTVTVAADNAPITMSDADMMLCLGSISILTTDYQTAFPGTPLNSIATKLLGGSNEFPFTVNATSLFAIAVVRGTPTYTSTSDLTFSYIIEQS